MIELFTTLANKRDAEKIAGILVKEKLAACVNYWKISSIYRWEGDVRSAGEWVLLVKTTEGKAKKAEKKIRELHSYELPVVVMHAVKIDKKVEKWVTKCMR